MKINNLAKNPTPSLGKIWKNPHFICDLELNRAEIFLRSMVGKKWPQLNAVEF